MLAAPGTPQSEHDVLPDMVLPWLLPVVPQQWPLAWFFLEGKGALDRPLITPGITVLVGTSLDEQQLCSIGLVALRFLHMAGDTMRTQELQEEEQLHHKGCLVPHLPPGPGPPTSTTKESDVSGCQTNPLLLANLSQLFSAAGRLT